MADIKTLHKQMFSTSNPFKKLEYVKSYAKQKKKSQQESSSGQYKKKSIVGIMVGNKTFNIWKKGDIYFITDSTGARVGGDFSSRNHAENFISRAYGSKKTEEETIVKKDVDQEKVYGYLTEKYPELKKTSDYPIIKPPTETVPTPIKEPLMTELTKSGTVYTGVVDTSKYKPKKTPDEMLIEKGHIIGSETSGKLVIIKESPYQIKHGYTPYDSDYLKTESSINKNINTLTSNISIIKSNIETAKSNIDMIQSNITKIESSPKDAEFNITYIDKTGKQIEEKMNKSEALSFFKSKLSDNKAVLTQQNLISDYKKDIKELRRQTEIIQGYKSLGYEMDVTDSGYTFKLPKPSKVHSWLVGDPEKEKILLTSSAFIESPLAIKTIGSGIQYLITGDEKVMEARHEELAQYSLGLQYDLKIGDYAGKIATSPAMTYGVYIPVSTFGLGLAMEGLSVGASYGGTAYKIVSAGSKIGMATVGTVALGTTAHGIYKTYQEKPETIGGVLSETAFSFGMAVSGYKAGQKFYKSYGMPKAPSQPFSDKFRLSYDKIKGKAISKSPTLERISTKLETFKSEGIEFKRMKGMYIEGWSDKPPSKFFSFKGKLKSLIYEPSVEDYMKMYGKTPSRADILLSGRTPYGKSYGVTSLEQLSARKLDPFATRQPSNIWGEYGTSWEHYWSTSELKPVIHEFRINKRAGLKQLNIDIQKGRVIKVMDIDAEPTYQQALMKGQSWSYIRLEDSKSITRLLPADKTIDVGVKDLGLVKVKPKIPYPTFETGKPTFSGIAGKDWGYVTSFDKGVSKVFTGTKLEFPKEFKAIGTGKGKVIYLMDKPYDVVTKDVKGVWQYDVQAFGKPLLSTSYYTTPSLITTSTSGQVWTPVSAIPMMQNVYDSTDVGLDKLLKKKKKQIVITDVDTNYVHPHWKDKAPSISNIFIKEPTTDISTYSVIASDSGFYKKSADRVKPKITVGTGGKSTFINVVKPKPINIIKPETISQIKHESISDISSAIKFDLVVKPLQKQALSLKQDVIQNLKLEKLSALKTITPENIFTSKVYPSEPTTITPFKPIKIPPPVIIEITEGDVGKIKKKKKKKYSLLLPRKNRKSILVKTVLAEPFSVQRSQAKYGKATHPLPTKEIWELGEKTGWKIPTLELMKEKKKKRNNKIKLNILGGKK